LEEAGMAPLCSRQSAPYSPDRALVRVAAISDVHGNPAALEAVLAEVQREQPDAIVFGGDLVSGPFPRATLELLRPLRNAHYVRGNGDRDVLALIEGGLRVDDASPGGKVNAWVAPQLTGEDRDFLAAFQDTVVLEVEGLGETCFCHGSPRSDEEVITHLTPDERLSEYLSDTEQPVVVCGHTHMQFERWSGETRVLNAGSVGMPYQGRRGAFWLLLGPEPDFRSTDYDVDAFVELIRASSYPEPDDFATILQRPYDSDGVAAFFEGMGPEPEPAGG
jgi:putative phosphoesterase